MSENHNDNGSSSRSSNGNNNWLGFSLSPYTYTKMESDTCSAQQERQHHEYHNHYIHQDHHHQQQQQFRFLSPPPHQEQHQQFNSTPPICFDDGRGGENVGFFQTPLTVMPLKSDGSLCIMEAYTTSQPPQAPKLENFLGISLDSIYRQQQQQQQQLESYISAVSSYQGFLEGDMLKNWVNNTVDNSMRGGFVNSGNNNDNNNNNHSCVSVAAPHMSNNSGDLESLSLSMSPGAGAGSHSSDVTVAITASPTTDIIIALNPHISTSSGNDCGSILTKKRVFGKVAQNKHTVHRKSIDTFGRRTSQFRGVTKHRWTGRYEAHLWDNSCKKEGQTRKGRQVYLGGYDMEEKAARAYDLAALKYWGLSTHTNCPIENYIQEIEEMKNMTRQEYVAHLRRKSSGFARGASMYRGVTRHHQHGRWQARIGRVAGNKDLYLGTFSTQEEAAEAYDVAAIKFRGTNAVTNFDISRYNVEKIMASNTLLAREQARRNKVELIQAVGECSTSTHNTAGEPAEAQNGSSSPLEWKMVCVDHHNPSPSLGLQDLVSLEIASPTRKIGVSAAHFSSASSLVTSLNSSREASPDENMSSSTLNSMVFSWKAASTTASTAVPVAHLPLFAA